jgi:hypothetical protein
MRLPLEERAALNPLKPNLRPADPMAKKGVDQRRRSQFQLPPNDLELRRCPSYPGYFAGRNGTIWTERVPSKSGLAHKDGLIRPKIPVIPPSGHAWVRIALGNGVYKNRYVHSMVADAFIGPRPEGMQVREPCLWNARAKRSG